jgi:hypothetical protein
MVRQSQQNYQKPKKTTKACMTLQLRTMQQHILAAESRLDWGTATVISRYSSKPQHELIIAQEI